MQINKKIIDHIRRFTENRQSTQLDIANFCGVSQSTISRVMATGDGTQDIEDKLIEYVAIKKKQEAKRKERITKIFKPVP